MNGELRNQWLLQQKVLYGNSLFVSKLENNQHKVFNHLINFNEQINDCKNYSLGEERTKFVFGYGNQNANIVLIGDVPDKFEDLKGEPFVDEAGKLLENILHSIGLDKNEIYLLNVLKCRTLKDREPLQKEIEKCESYLITQINLIKPKLIIALGNIAAKTLLKKDLPISKLRNNLYNYKGIDLIITYHPKTLLKNPNLKRPVWEDFKKIKNNYLS